MADLRAVQYNPRVVDRELDELIAEGAPALALTGAKAVGKSASAAQRATEVFALDDDSARVGVEADPQRLLHGECVLIDEWQRFPQSWDLVRRAVDAGAGPGRFLLTGSVSAVHTPTHTGAGRILVVRMRPLSLAERGKVAPAVSMAELLSGRQALVAGGCSLRLADYVDEMVRSGFPGIRDSPGRRRRAELDGYLQRVVDREIVELGRAVRNPAALMRWMRAYAAATSTPASLESIRDAATGGVNDKPARSTTIPYRDALERLYILDPLPAWVPRARAINRLGAAPKHHLADPALAVRLLGIDADGLLDASGRGSGAAMLGPIFESLVTMSVRVYAQQCEATVGHLRSHRGDREIDLIVERSDGKVVAIEVKLTAAVDDDDVRHLRWLKEQLGPDLLDAVVVTTGPEAYRRRDGIAVVPAALLGA